MAAWWPSRLERRIALRYLRGQRGTRSASLQTMIAVGGIAVGVASLIVVLGVMNGLRDDLRDKILIASPHVRVMTYGSNLVMDDWPTALRKIRADPAVVAAAPEVSSYTLIQNTAGFADGAYVVGLEPGVGTREVLRIDTAITRGELRFTSSIPETQGGVLLGERLADRLGVLPGDLVTIVSPASIKTSRALGTAAVARWSMEVTGIFRTGMYIYDNNYVVMDRKTGQDFAGLDSAVSDIAVRLRDPYTAATVARRLADSLGYQYRTETWEHQNAALFSALELEKLAMGLVIFFIMVVAAFNIVGTLTMVVAFKTREIGILQAMGLPARGVGRIFLAQGAIVGAVGTGIGLVTGLAIALVVDRTGLIRINPEVYFIEKLPIRVEPLDVVVVVCAAVLVAILATIHPARRASRLVPVEAIRAE